MPYHQARPERHQEKHISDSKRHAKHYFRRYKRQRPAEQKAAYYIIKGNILQSERHPFG